MSAAPPHARDARFEGVHPELIPAWHIFVPLVVVIVTLLALAVAPFWLLHENTAVRRTFRELLVPLSERVADVERGIAAEVAAARGFALTGDPVFVERFDGVHDQTVEAISDVRRLAGHWGGEVELAATDLVRATEAWDAVNLGRTPAEFTAGLTEHQLRYEAVMLAARHLDGLLVASGQRQRQRIEQAEALHAQITVGLALVALLAAGAPLWLAFQLRRSGRYLLRRMREEVALRQVAEAMAAAPDPTEAFQRITDAVAEAAGADGVRLERLSPDRSGVEVVAVSGTGEGATGAHAPFEGSLTERALRGEGGDETPAGPASEPGDRLITVPLHSEGEALGALVLHRARQRPPFDEEDRWATRVFAGLAALALRRGRLAEEVRRNGAQLQATAEELRLLNETLEERVRTRTHQVQDLSRALTLTEQRERRELAQVLHDDLQQTLYGLQLSLKTLHLRAPSLGADGLAQELERAHDLVGEAITSTRRLTVDLSPPVLAGEGLEAALRWLAAHVQERFGLAVGVEVGEGVAAPADDVRVLLFQAARELLFNTVKHAQASAATVTVSEADGRLELEVVDDGVGFEAATPSSTLGGFGLRGVRERLELFGGALRMTSERGKGTRALVTLPVEALAERAGGG